MLVLTRIEHDQSLVTESEDAKSILALLYRNILYFQRINKPDRERLKYDYTNATMFHNYLLRNGNRPELCCYHKCE